MSKEERSWGVLVITAAVLVSLFMIVLGCVKGCGSSAAAESSAAGDNPSVVTCGDATSPCTGEARANDIRPYGPRTARGSLPQSPAATAPSSEGAEDAETEFREQIAAQVDVAPEREYIGRCRLTVYTPTESSYGYQTATGATSAHLMTCAVDPKVIPYGSNVTLICADGSEWRLKAVDCGGFSGRWVDIFFDGRIAAGIDWLDECFGGDYAEVYIEEAQL